MNTLVIDKILNDDILFVDKYDNIFTNNSKVKVIDWWGHLINYGKVYLKTINNECHITFKYWLKNQDTSKYFPVVINYIWMKNKENIPCEYAKEEYVYKYHRKCVRCFGFLVNDK